jgi:hypothetical protein
MLLTHQCRLDFFELRSDFELTYGLAIGHENTMDNRTKDISLKVIFRGFQAVGWAILLTIPAVLIYKLTQGANWLICLSILVVYLGSFVGNGYLMLRVKRLDPLWCSLFGLSFFVLLFFSLKL